jgi:hypothetical protein
VAGIRITGLDEMQRKLANLARRAENASGSVAFEELFPPEFMRRYTEFKTIDDMFAASPWTVESAEDFERVPEQEWNRYVSDKTKFKTWNDMQAKAGEEYLERRLNLDGL